MSKIDVVLVRFLVSTVDAVVHLGTQRPVACTRDWCILTPDEAVGAVLNCVEAAVAVVIDVAVVQVRVVAVLFHHAEFRHASFSVAARLWFALVL